MKMDKNSPDYQKLRFESRGLAQEAGKRGGGAEDSGKVYDVVSGDSLWKIAKKKLGSGARWTRIFSLNAVNILDPNLIQVGQKLKLPKP